MSSLADENYDTKHVSARFFLINFLIGKNITMSARSTELADFTTEETN